MFAFGHLGIGTQLFRPWISKGTLPYFCLGALLPDLIDKTTYYLACWLTGLQGASLPLIHGTRIFGHTGLFLAVFAGLSYWAKSAPLKALAWGVLSHLLLDVASDQLNTFRPSAIFSNIPLLWPFDGRGFPLAHYLTLEAHFLSLTKPILLASEVIGVLLCLHIRSRLKKSTQAQLKDALNF